MAKSKKRIKITAGNLVGKYGLGYSIDDVVEMESKQADELLNSGDAREFSKETEAKEKKEAEEAEKDTDSERTSELKKLKRADLDDIAKELELNPEDFKTIDDIIPAIVEAEEKSE